MRRGVPARSRLQEGLITRRGHLVSRSWGDLKPLLASVRSPHTLGEATGVCVRSPFRVPPARTGSRSRVGFREAVDTGRRRRQVARSAPPPRPGPAPRPAPPPCAPGSGSRPRCCGDCSRQRRRRQSERPWRRAPRPAREPRAGAAQVRAAPPSPLHRRSFLFSIFPTCRPPGLPSLRCSHLPLLSLSPSIPPLSRAWSPSFPLGLLPPAASSPAVLSLSPLHHVCPAQGGSRPRTPSGPEGF